MTGWRWLVGTALVLAVGITTWATPGAISLLGTWSGAETAASGPAPAHPWRPGRPELGVQVYWVDDPADTPELIRRKAERIFDHVIGMEANAASISFPFYSESITASTVLTDRRTPTPDRLAVVVDEARRSGLRVAVRPLLDEANLLQHDARDWRGGLQPVDRNAWYASYQDFLGPYLTMAQQHRVDTFMIAAELNSLQGDPHWAPMIAQARTLYHGEIGYAANWDAYPQAKAGVPADGVGIDAYPRLGLAAGASAAQMHDAWRAWLDATAPGQDVVLYEVGAAAEPRMMDNPAIPNTPGAALDKTVQRRWFAAACSAARERGLRGLYWWKLELDDDPAAADPVDDLHDSFLGRPAEEAIRQCFSAWAGTP
ncbi:glycoside hydrolase family 113 [Pseudonocardia sp. GCM10023141]|uniref:glycoside hydrolase family 113 n=1 Tax=Pseudonocardia sp. GCM10023141 TaxID=3252653 RepID=UPI00360D8A86